MGENLPAIQETGVQTLSWEESLEEEIGNPLQYSSPHEQRSLAGQFMGSQIQTPLSDKHIHFHFSNLSINTASFFLTGNIFIYSICVSYLHIHIFRLLHFYSGTCGTQDLKQMFFSFSLESNRCSWLLLQQKLECIETHFPFLYHDTLLGRLLFDTARSGQGFCKEK